MAFIKLIPPEDRESLPVDEVIERLRSEFGFVHSDPAAGQAHVSAMIVATQRLSDKLPFKQERLSWLQAAQDSAVHVSFGVDSSVVASCCLMRDSELFFGRGEEVDGAARPLVDRAAVALGYSIFEG